MIDIESVNPTGLFSYSLHQTVQIAKVGLVLVNGINKDRFNGSNGSGKSSLFNAMVQIIFGKNPSDEYGEAVINKKLKKSFGRLIFRDQTGTRWRITDLKKWKREPRSPDAILNLSHEEEPSEWLNSGNVYSGTDVFLERWCVKSNLWIDERATGKPGELRLDLKSTRKKILDIISMDYDQYMSVSYLAQQKSMKFINGTHKERLEVLSEVAGISVWDKRVAAIRTSLSELKANKDVLLGKLNALEQAGNFITQPTDDEISATELQILNITVEVGVIDAELKELTDKKSNIAGIIDLLDVQIKNNLDNIKKCWAKRQSAQLILSEIASKYAADCEEVRRQTSLDISLMENDVSNTAGLLSAKRHELEQLMSGSGKCTRCRTNVTINHLERQRELLGFEIRDLNETLAILKTKLQDTRDAWNISIIDQLDGLNNIFIQNRDVINADINTFDEFIHKYNTDNDLLKAERMGLMAGATDQEIALLTQRRLFAISDVMRATTQLAEFKERQRKYTEYVSVIKDITDAMLKSETEIRYLVVIEKLFGDKGIKAYKLDSILASLNAYMKQFIDIISDGTVNVTISQYREKTDGSSATDIQILVKENDKEDVPFALYSGGEKQQIMLAFIGALWQVASQAGAGVNIMCLDEIFGPLDAYNANKMFDYIEHLKSIGKSSVFIITHEQSIKEHIAFDATWTVIKQDHTSTIDILDTKQDMAKLE